MFDLSRYFTHMVVIQTTFPINISLVVHKSTVLVGHKQFFFTNSRYPNYEKTLYV